MWQRIIAYFADRHLVTNFIVFAVLLGGVVSWWSTNKEELPDITFDQVRISIGYPGASAKDVEYFVTEPIERQVRGLDGVHRVTSTSSSGRSSITVELEQDLPNRDEVITEIRNTVLNVDLPEEVLDDPSIRVFQTSKKAIVDVVLYHKEHRLLSVEARRELQRYAFALESRLLSLPEINSVNRNGYLREEIHIKTDPDQLRRYDIPFNSVMTQVRENHVRRPAGVLETEREPKVTLAAELDTPEKLRDLAIEGGFDGRLIKLGSVATIERAFEKNEAIRKVNGHEAILLNVVKNSGSGILVALDAVRETIDAFREHNLAGTPVELILLDDESIDVRNRLDIIKKNGTLGFILILATLFLFLNKRSGLWVAIGIPFCLCFTMIGASWLGYSINGTTLAAVIIVMGMVVDDAIVVAENISRLSHQGVPQREAVIKGTSYVLLPITAAIATTCVAFLPLFNFSGRHGAMIQFIPPIIFLMLGASLFESIFILPGHMQLEPPALGRWRKKSKMASIQNGHWFDTIEQKFGSLLGKILPYRWFVLLGFLVLFGLSGWIATARMEFVMFPDEETRDISINGITPPGTGRTETARRVEEIENKIIPYIGKEVVGFRTDVARSRRGGTVEENRFRISVEIVPPEKRKKSADALIQEFKGAIEPLEGFSELRFSKSRWGQTSGSPIEVLVQVNDDKVRSAVTHALADAMRADPALKNTEIDEGLRSPEYRIDFDREKIKRLSISPANISSTFRAALEGSVLYEFSNGDEEVFVRFTTKDDVKTDIEKVLDLPVENRQNYLVPLRNIIRAEETTSLVSIEREEMKRTSLVYADIEKSSGKTPLLIAEKYEKEVFPPLLGQFPTARLTFGGEVKDTRESQSDLAKAILMVIFLIYAILAILFNSLTTPLIIMLTIPFGVIGIVLAFYLHGKVLFGFFAAVGALGLAGVVINDAIVLLVKLRDDFTAGENRAETYARIAGIAKTRLRAVILTTVTTVAGLLPTAYGFGGYDAMLADMMLALSWGLIFGTAITLILIPCVFSFEQDFRQVWRRVLHGDHA